MCPEKAVGYIKFKTTTESVTDRYRTRIEIIIKGEIYIIRSLSCNIIETFLSIE